MHVYAYVESWNYLLNFKTNFCGNDGWITLVSDVLKEKARSPSRVLSIIARLSSQKTHSLTHSLTHSRAHARTRTLTPMTCDDSTRLDLLLLLGQQKGVHGVSSSPEGLKQQQAAAARRDVATRVECVK